MVKSTQMRKKLGFFLMSASLSGLIFFLSPARKSEAVNSFCPVAFRQAAYGQYMSLGNGLTLKIWPKSQSFTGLGEWRMIWAAYNQGSPVSTTAYIAKTGCLSSTVGNTCGLDKAVPGTVESLAVNHIFPAGYSEFIARGQVWSGWYPYCFLWQADLEKLIIHSSSGNREVKWGTSWFTLRN
jgi:hypothetical protein